MASADAADSGLADSLPSSATDTRLSSTLTPESSTDSSEGHLNPRGSIRRKLSKQKGVEEAEIKPPSPLPILEESFVNEKIITEKEDSPTGMNSRSRQLVRGLALCGDDDTRLRPPPPVVLQRHSHSLSRDSSGTEYTDGSGVDLKAFVVATLHKNPRDRQMALHLEQQLTMFINEQSAQSFKFPQMSSYNRMLIHRVAALFGLDHNVDNSGKCVVVNKTDRTARPDFDFASLIMSQQFSDFSHHGHSPRRPYRSVQSVDEPRDPSLLGYGYGSVDIWQNRKPHSFDAPYVGHGSPYYYSNGTHSMDQGQQAHYEPERTAILRKAGSFGGTPAYYRAGNSLENGDRGVRGDYSSHGSMGSPATVAEPLSDGMAAMQISPRVQVMANYNYGYHQPLYVNPPTMSPSAYGSNYIVSTTVHQVTIPTPASLSYASSPHSYYPPSNGYPEPEYAAAAGYPAPGSYAYPATAAQPSPVPYIMPQTYYEYNGYPGESVPATPSENTPGDSSQSASVQTAMANPPLSLDRGYGSLTNQDSLREETDYTS